MLRRKVVAQRGGHSLEDARMLADLTGQALDERTVDDLELGRVFAAIDRTRTVTGAQVLWRWLVTPSQDRAELAAREARIRDLDVGALAVEHARDLPQLLWGEPIAALRGRTVALLLAALVGSVVLGLFWHPALLVAMLLFGANVVIDDWAKLRLANATRSLEQLDGVLGRVAALPDPPDLRAGAGLRRRMAILRAKDPFELLDVLRAGLLIRLAVTLGCLRLVAVHREALRGIVLWFGELDALASIAALRSAQTRVPALVDGPPMLAATDLVHPAVEHAIGNDVALASSGLLVTGSNMSGKSTLLRTIAVNAILAQSIHTTFGAWRATPLHVRSVMRIADDPSRGLSTYAVEVAAMGELIAESRPCLFLVDEPFNGTNPAVRVPIVVAVLEYLVGRGLVVAATHDLDVATRLDDRFQRAYFEERDGGFDRHLHPGIAPATNAVEILRRAGYPDEITRRLA